MKHVDINVDVGEGGAFDADLLIYATSANICCGAHAGSWDLTEHTIGLALDAHVRIGMHPGYPDRDNMGRRSMTRDDRKAFERSLELQVDRFFNFVPAAYLKPHGAFYWDAIEALHPAFLILERLCSKYQLPVMGLAGTPHEGAGAAFISEGFADRGYQPNGRLIPRGQPGDLLHDMEAVATQAVYLAQHVDTICVHGDTPGCMQIIEVVSKALVDAGFRVGY